MTLNASRLMGWPLQQIHMPLQPKQDPIKNLEEKLGTLCLPRLNWQAPVPWSAMPRSAAPLCGLASSTLPTTRRRVILKWQPTPTRS